MTAREPDRQGRVAAGPLELHYVEWGPAEGPPVVLLHGITGHARTWDDLAARLAPPCRAIALDLRGHGDSTPASDGDYTVGALAGDFAAFVDALGLSRFALVGLSLGGRVAIAYAGARPERVERLVVVDIGPDIAPEGLQRIRGMMAGAPEALASEDQAAEYVLRANPRYDPVALRQRIRHGLRRLPDGTLTWKYDRTLREMMRAGGRRDGVDLWDPLGRIGCPTLLVRGAESDILSPEIARRMLQALPQGRLVEIPGAGHTVPGDQPAAFASAVREFLGLL
jgi:pimeloyl-ACP methyl ester carboxylesterase